MLLDESAKDAIRYPSNVLALEKGSGTGVEWIWCTLG
jgi:hypothetical protein